MSMENYYAQLIAEGRTSLLGEYDFMPTSKARALKREKAGLPEEELPDHEADSASEPELV